MKLEMVSKFKVYLMLVLLFTALTLQPVHAVKIRSFCRILGADPMHVEGVGIVIGLNGTGDSQDAVKIAQKKYLEANKYNFSLADLSSKNIAFVSIDAEIEPFAKVGEKVTLRVSSIGDASSLKNGVLKLCYLKYHADGEAKVQATGRVLVGDNPTTGMISSGGKLLKGRMLNQKIVDKNGIFKLQMNKYSFKNAAQVENVINGDRRTNPNRTQVVGFEQKEARKVARASDGKEIVVQIPEKFKRNIVRYIAEVRDLDVELEPEAIIRINQQSGTAVVSGDVTVMRGLISYRGRTVTLAEPRENEAPRYNLDADTPRPVADVGGPGESGGEGRVSLQSLIDTLAAMRCDTDDVIQILVKLKETGLIQAELILE